jgi:predicted nucleic acid-binding protein
VGQVIDTSVWIDHLRERTPDATRQIADSAVNEADALLCEQVRFELLYGASRRERPPLLRRLATMPLLHTPPRLWHDASDLAATACDAGLRVPSVDLLIAALCIHHDVALTTFDGHFGKLAKLSKLRVNLLIRSD